jgi:hypothetical protein
MRARGKTLANARRGCTVTGVGVRRPGGNHVDRRRRLLPRDYLSDPDAFGRNRAVRFIIPAGGDAESGAIARVQHELVLRWRAQGCRPSGSRLGRSFGFSKQTWSRSTLGQRWMGEAVICALLAGITSPDENCRSGSATRRFST